MESNRGRPPLQGGALPAELNRQMYLLNAQKINMKQRNYSITISIIEQVLFALTKIEKVHQTKEKFT